MAPVKKSKSAKTSENINSRLQLVVKSGKVGLRSLGRAWADLCSGWMDGWRDGPSGRIDSRADVGMVRPGDERWNSRTEINAPTAAPQYGQWTYS